MTTLSGPQKRLLSEIKEAGVLYIKRYGPYYRTIEALERKRMVVCVAPDYSRNAQDGYAVLERSTDG